MIKKNKIFLFIPLNHLFVLQVVSVNPKSVVRISPLRGIAYNILKISMLEIQFSNGGH